MVPHTSSSHNQRKNRHKVIDDAVPSWSPLIYDTLFPLRSTPVVFYHWKNRIHLPIHLSIYLYKYVKGRSSTFLPVRNGHGGCGWDCDAGAEGDMSQEGHESPGLMSWWWGSPRHVPSPFSLQSADGATWATKKPFCLSVSLSSVGWIPSFIRRGVPCLFSLSREVWKDNECVKRSTPNSFAKKGCRSKNIHVGGVWFTTVITIPTIIIFYFFTCYFFTRNKWRRRCVSLHLTRHAGRGI